MRRLLLAITLVLVPGAFPSGVAAAPRCGGEAVTIAGTSGRDRIRGTVRGDVIAGRGGADRISGRAGADAICGGPGRDRIRGGRGGDLLLGGTGADTLDGDQGRDRVKGGSGPDRCFQGPGKGPVRGCVPVVAAAGDIACATDDPNFNDTRGSARYCRMRATSALLLRTDLAAVLPLGDTQYGDASLEQYMASYHPTWGRVRDITRPVPGNHEYDQPGAAGYFEYFGPSAGDPSKGYYSFDIGRWHLVALNTNADCTKVACSHGSPQHAWLVDDLASSAARCTLAYWHEPRFTSQGNDDPKVGPFWEALAADRGEIVLNGHAHAYERFAPQSPAGERSATGIRQFTVGTGGRDLRAFDGSKSTSQVRNSTSFGILEIALAPKGYDWRFVSEPGSPPFTDRGSGRCR